MNVNVYSFGTCVKTTTAYSNYDNCTIDVLEDCELEVKSFDTESGYDFLKVNGEEYAGSGVAYGPEDVFVMEGHNITFYADISNTGTGFDICAKRATGAPSNAPTRSSTDFEHLVSTPNLYYIIACAPFVFCAIIFSCFMTSKQKKYNNPEQHIDEGGQVHRMQQADGVWRDNGPKSGPLSEQNIEGVRDIELIEPRPLVQKDSDNRPVYTFCSHDEIPMPQFESDLTIRDVPLEYLKDEMPDSTPGNLAPAATEIWDADWNQVANLGPPADLPPPYDDLGPPGDLPSPHDDLGPPGYLPPPDHAPPNYTPEGEAKV